VFLYVCDATANCASTVDATVTRVQFSAGSISAVCGTVCNAIEKWEPEAGTPETWTPVDPATEIWQTVPNTAEVWTVVSP
jgi:hypothetical protein